MSVRNRSSEFIGSATQRGASGPTAPSTSSIALDVEIFAINDAGGRIESDPVIDSSIRVLFSWTRPVAAWAVTAASVVWNDTNSKTGRFYAAQGVGAAYVAFLDLPDESLGNVVITVPEQSATAQDDATITGPPADRSITIPYDTREATHTVPTVELINGDEIATEAIKELHLVWSEPVGGFSLSECSITAGTLTSMTAIRQAPNKTASQYVVRWTIPTSGTGTATFRVLMHSGRGATREGPGVDYTANIRYSANQVTTIYVDGTTTAATVTATRTQTFAQARGAYYGVNEMHVHGGNIYATVQKVNNLGSTPNDFLNYSQRGSAELLQISSGSASVIRQYNDCETAPRGFASYDSGNGSRLHFIRGSHWLYEYEHDSMGREVNRRSETTPENWREVAGGIYELATSTPTLIARAGISNLQDPEPVTYDQFSNPDGHRADPYYGSFGGTASPLVVDSGDMYYLAGFGNLSSIGTVPTGSTEFNPESHIDNWLLSKITTTIEPRIEILNTNNRTIFSVIEEIAFLSNSRWGFTPQGNFYFLPNEPVSAELNASITASSNSFTTKNETHVGNVFIPASGTVLIDNEVISYSSISNNTFSGVSRGLHGTTAATHGANAKVYWINNFIGFGENIEIRQEDFSIDQNRQNLYNNIEINYGENRAVFAKDTTSINTYGERTYQQQISASDNQTHLAQFLADEHLERLKDPRMVVTLVIDLETDIDVGHTLYVRDPRLTYLAHIVYVTEVKQTIVGYKTEITGIKI